MINREFYNLFHALRNERGNGPKWTVARMADAIYCSRAYVQDVVNDRSAHGRLVRRKVVKFLKREFPTMWPRMLAALGWTDKGERLVKSHISDVLHGTR